METVRWKMMNEHDEDKIRTPSVAEASTYITYDGVFGFDHLDAILQGIQDIRLPPSP
jgi:hypothetical protein